LYVLIAVLVGFFAIGLTNMFGIGGAAIATPAIRIFLAASPAIALGTTLPVTIPAAAAGAFVYYRRGFVEKRVAAHCSAGGFAGAVGGAIMTRFINLHYLMLVTGAVVLYVAVVTAYRGITGRGTKLKTQGRAPGPEEEREPVEERASAPLSLGIGLAAGLFSGLLGLGGGIILIPSFLYLLHMPLKKTFGTSLAVITVVAIPGTVVHSLLQHISWSLVLYLVIGSIPGAYVGVRIGIRTRERVLYVLFGMLLFAFGIIFIVSEIVRMIH